MKRALVATALLLTLAACKPAAVSSSAGRSVDEVATAAGGAADEAAPPVSVPAAVGATAATSTPPPDVDPPPGTPPAGPPPAAPIFELPMQMVGTEPFWGGMITADTITIEGADRAKLTMPAGERKVTGAGVSWRTRTVKGSPTEASVVLVRETCSDGMSDKRYPFEATVTLGAETLTGCAIRRADFGGER